MKVFVAVCSFEGTLYGIFSTEEKAHAFTEAHPSTSMSIVAEHIDEPVFGVFRV